MAAINVGISYSMAKKKRKKFYVVWKGRKTGIFETWEECKAQVENYPNAEYKAFYDPQMAEKAFNASYLEYLHVPVTDKEPLSEDELRRIGEPIVESYAVDASCIGSPGPMEYRCVHTITRKEIFRRGPFNDGTNNIGEFLAIVHALALFKETKNTAPIYSDSKIAIDWIEKQKCRTKLMHTNNNTELFQLIDRAEKWLTENNYENQVLKWWSEVWGENPADFGRK